MLSGAPITEARANIGTDYTDKKYTELVSLDFPSLTRPTAFSEWAEALDRAHSTSSQTLQSEFQRQKNANEERY